MVKFVDIDPAEIDTSRGGRRGRVTYPIIKAFLEREVKVSMLDLSDSPRTPNSMRAGLDNYVKGHKLPIKVFTAGGQVHLMRLDLDNDNNKIPWQPEDGDTSDPDNLAHLEATPLNAKSVKKRAKENKDSAK